MAQLFKNNARSQLVNQLTPGQTLVYVESGEGQRFPSPTGGDFCLVTIQDATNIEIVKVVSRAGDILTVVRAQEGTAESTFAVGTSVGLRLTAAAVELAIAHPSNTGSAHAASAITTVGVPGLAATQLQTMLGLISAALQERLVTNQFLTGLSIATTQLETSIAEGGYDPRPAVAVWDAGAVTLQSAPHVNRGTLGAVRFYTTAGAHTWTKPEGLARIRVTVVGAGGGSGGAGTTAIPGSGGGGGGGTGIRVIEESALTAASYTVTVGDGGTAGTSSGAGGIGGTSSFDTLVTATGGNGGGLKTAGGVAGGAGGVGAGSGTTLGIAGAPGGNGYSMHGGGSTHGAGPRGPHADAPGVAGRVYGGGAAGCYGSNVTGGAGAVGIVIVEEFY